MLESLFGKVRFGWHGDWTVIYLYFPDVQAQHCGDRIEKGFDRMRQGEVRSCEATMSGAIQSCKHDCYKIS